MQVRVGSQLGLEGAFTGRRRHGLPRLLPHALQDAALRVPVQLQVLHHRLCNLPGRPGDKAQVNF